MDQKNSFGNILRRLRKEKRKKWIEKGQWTIVAVARRIRVSRPAYYAWENDTSLPGVEHLKRIIEVFRPSEQDELALYRAAALPPAAIHKFPLPRNPFFTGRERQLDQLRQSLQEAGIVGIIGLGGIGKTQIALEYAHQYHLTTYRTVLWVNAADRTTLQTDYDAVTHLLALPERDEQDADRRIEAVKRWLDEHTSWLLIMDNADDLQLARSFMPEKPLGHIILTTRSQAIRESTIAVQIEVEEMKAEEGLTFLLRRAGLLKKDEPFDDVATGVRSAAAALVTLLGRHPLALDQAGAYIEASGMSLADYLQIYREEHQQFLDKRGPPKNENSPDEHPDTVTVTVQLSFIKACERHAKVADMLHFCSFLQPDAIPEELFYPNSSLQLTLRSFNDAMVALRRYSLVTRNAHEKLFSMHRLVQAVLIDTLSADLQKQWRERVVRALYAVFPEVDFKTWQQCGRLLPHALVCAMWTEDELAMTGEAAELLTKACIYLQEQGHYSEAGEILFRVLKFWDKQLGVSHPTTAAAAHRLAQLFKKRGMYDAAKEYYQWALIAYEKHLGIGHPAMASALSELGTLYASQRKYKNATTLISLAILIQGRRLGDSHPATLRSQSELATIFRHQGKYDTAIRIYEETLIALERNLGSNHPDSISAARELGMAYLLKGEYQQAELFLTQLVDLCRQSLGEDHPDTAKSVIALAWLFYEQGKYKHSGNLYLRVLASRKIRAEMDPRDTARAFYGLALIQHKQRNYELAEELYLRAIQIYERAGGISVSALGLKKSYAVLLRDTQRHTDAAALEASDDLPYDEDKDELDKDAVHYFALLMAARRHSQSPFEP